MIIKIEILFLGFADMSSTNCLYGTITYIFSPWVSGTELLIVTVFLALLTNYDI